MRHLEPAFGAELGETVIRVHAQIAGIRTDIPGDETGCVKGGWVTIFDGGDIVGLDPKLALHIKQRLAHGGAFAPHGIAQTQFEIVEAARLLLFYVCRLALRPAPDHPAAPS